MKIRRIGWASPQRVLPLLVLALQALGAGGALVHRAHHADEHAGAAEVRAACPLECCTDGHEHDADHGTCAACKARGAPSVHSAVAELRAPVAPRLRLSSDRPVLVGLMARAAARVRGPPHPSATTRVG